MSEEQEEKWYKAFTREQLIERCKYLQRSCERKEEQITDLDDENFDLENEIERLNKIINESAEEILKELEENHHLSYGVALAIRQKLLDYKELKGADKE